MQMETQKLTLTAKGTKGWKLVVGSIPYHLFSFLFLYWEKS